MDLLTVTQKLLKIIKKMTQKLLKKYLKVSVLRWGMKTGGYTFYCTAYRMLLQFLG